MRISVIVMVSYILFKILNLTIGVNVLGAVILFLPGFLLTKNIMKKIETDESETVVLTVMFSIALVTLIMFILNYGGFGITVDNFIISMFAMIILLLLVFVYRESRYI